MKLRTGLAAALALGSFQLAQLEEAGDFMPTGGGPPPSYTGPGDVKSGATAWWGLRAYSAAVAGTKAINIRCNGGANNNLQFDINTIVSTGILDIATASADCPGATSIVITKYYEQSGGSTCDMSQTTAAKQATLTPSGIGSLPVVTYPNTGVNWNYVATNGCLSTHAQPLTYSWVAKRTANFTSLEYDIYYQNGSVVPPSSGFSNAANTIFLNASTALTAAGTDSVWHAVQAVFNGASSDLVVDGTVTTGAGGASSFSGTTGFTFAGNSSIQSFTGTWGETGVWSLGFNSTEEANMNSNQHTYWGF